MTLVAHYICSAFDNLTIGTKVLIERRMAMHNALIRAIESHDPGKDEILGQHEIVLPKAAHELVSCGVGLRRKDPEDYVLRAHRGRVDAFLKRAFAYDTGHLAASIYTREALFADPETSAEDRARYETASHILVSLRAQISPVDRMTPFRLVANLAGGNRAAMKWDIERIRAEALSALGEYKLWSVVAD